MSLTQSELRRVLHYNRKTGLFRWRCGQRAGQIAGTVKDNGYIAIVIARRPYYAHRLAWLYVKGSFPPDILDHKNGKRSDNRFINIRIATSGQNVAAGKIRCTNKSGFKGVSWSKVAGKWWAQIVVDGQHYHLGLYESPEAAHAAYIAATRRHFGAFRPKITKRAA